MCNEPNTDSPARRWANEQIALARTLGEPVAVHDVQHIETLDYYDGPLATISSLAIEGRGDDAFYGHIVSCERGGEHWMFVPVDEAGIAGITNNRIALRDVLTGAPYAVVVITDWSDGQARHEGRLLLPAADLPEEWLPEPGIGLRPGSLEENDAAGP